MNRQSLLIGILIGVCLCLVVMLFQVPQAQAASVGSGPRYQLAADSDNFWVLDAITGDVYAIRWNLQRKRFGYVRIVHGPPR